MYRGFVRYRKLILHFKARTEDSHASSEILILLHLKSLGWVRLRADRRINPHAPRV